MTHAKPLRKPKTNQRKLAGPRGSGGGAKTATDPVKLTPRPAPKNKPAIVPGIAARPRALFDRQLKAILRSANAALVAVGDDLAKSCDVGDDDELSDVEIQRFYLARRVASLVLELGEIGEVVGFANNQGEFAIADELSIQLGVIGTRVADLGELYIALRVDANA